MEQVELGAFQLLNPRDVPRGFENSAANFSTPVAVYIGITVDA